MRVPLLRLSRVTFASMLATTLLATEVVVARQARAGTTRRGATFDVASVRPNRTGRLGPKSVSTTGNRVSIINAPLLQLIQMAYRVDAERIAGGPSWLNDDGFDIEATVESPFASADVWQAMLGGLLVERFKLVAHRESREATRLVLIVARSDGRLGSGLRPATASCRELMSAATPARPDPCGIPARALITGRMNVRGLRVLDLVAVIQRDLKQAVVDETGLMGNFDWDVRWTPSAFAQVPLDRARFPEIDPDGPGIGTAIEEQLGLKLVTRRSPVEFLVIDAVERPTEN